MDEGLLHEAAGKIFPHDELECYLYGFNNRYGLLIRRAYGGPPGTETVNAEKGLFEVTPIGIGLKAEEIRMIPRKGIQALAEKLSADEIQAFVCSPAIHEFVGNFNEETSRFNSISKEDFSKFTEAAKAQPERPASHIVEDPIMNPYYSVEEAAKKYKTKTHKPSEEEINKFLNG